MVGVRLSGLGLVLGIGCGLELGTGLLGARLAELEARDGEHGQVGAAAVEGAVAVGGGGAVVRALGTGRVIRGRLTGGDFEVGWFGVGWFGVGRFGVG